MSVLVATVVLVYVILLKQVSSNLTCVEDSLTSSIRLWAVSKVSLHADGFLRYHLGRPVLLVKVVKVIYLSTKLIASRSRRSIRSWVTLGISHLLEDVLLDRLLSFSLKRPVFLKLVKSEVDTPRLEIPLIVELLITLLLNHVFEISNVLGSFSLFNFILLSHCNKLLKLICKLVVLFLHGCAQLAHATSEASLHLIHASFHGHGLMWLCVAAPWSHGYACITFDIHLMSLCRCGLVERMLRRHGWLLLHHCLFVFHYLHVALLLLTKSFSFFFKLLLLKS